MYERFTDRARQVMQLANQEAQRFSREAIGTEHLLHGLIREGAGIASEVFTNLGIDRAKLRLEADKLVGAGSPVIPGGDGKLPLTKAARRVVNFAIEEAKYLQHNYIGTEHLLLGLLYPVDDSVGAEGSATRLLREGFGLTLERVRDEVRRIVQPKEEQFEGAGFTTEEVKALWKVDWPRTMSWTEPSSMADILRRLERLESAVFAGKPPYHPPGCPCDFCKSVREVAGRAAAHVPPEVKERMLVSYKDGLRKALAAAAGFTQPVVPEYKFHTAEDCAKIQAQLERDGLAEPMKQADEPKDAPASPNPFAPEAQKSSRTDLP